MAISGISQSVSLLNAYSNQAQGNDVHGSPLAAPQQKNSAVQTELSHYGQVRNSLAELKTSARVLKESSQSSSGNEIKVAVQNFVQSYNNLNQQVQVPSVQQSGASRSDPRSVSALQDINKALNVNGDGAGGALEKLGLERQKDGGLGLNQAALDKAADNKALAGQYGELADRVIQAADRQLSISASNGAQGGTVQNSNSISRDQENSQKSAQDQQEARRLQQQRLTAQLESASGHTGRTAVSSYFSVASL